jgi:hypothetical protein
VPVPKATAVSLAPKRKVAADDEVLLIITVPSVDAVSALIVWVVPFRSTVAVSVVSNSGLMIRPPLAAKVSAVPEATSVVGATLAVNVVALSIEMILLPAGTLVPVNCCPTVRPAVLLTV